MSPCCDHFPSVNSVESFYNLCKLFLWKLSCFVLFTILISVFFEWFLAFLNSIDFIIDDLITEILVIITFVTEVVKLCNNFSCRQQ